MKLKLSIHQKSGDNDEAKVAREWELKEVEIKNEQDARNIFCKYHYSANEWKNGHKIKANFIRSHFICGDADEGLTIDEIRERFSAIPHIIVTSRNHMKQKKNKPPCERFHVILPIKKPIENVQILEKLALAKLFEGFDPAVFHADRCIFASPEEAEIYVNLEGDVMDVDTLEYIEKPGLNLKDTWTPKSKESFNYPETVIDQYGDVTSIDYFEEHGVREDDLKSGKPENSVRKFYCPISGCQHNSASSYVLIKEDGNFCIDDHKHKDTRIWKQEPLEHRCKDWYRIGSQYHEAVILQHEKKVVLSKRGDKDVAVRLGKKAADYIILKRSLYDTVPFHFIGGGGKELSYEYKKDQFIAYHPVPEVVMKDNGLINNLLEETFGFYSQFIKEWIAVYTNTNFRKLPILIFTGPRGVGKNLIAEMVGDIYPQLWTRFDTRTNFTEHNGMKLALIDEADESDNSLLYPVLKDIGGSERLVVNEKYGRKYEVRNNLNVIVLSNDPLPLFLRSHERPLDKYNNQFFVYNFQKPKRLDSSLKFRIRQRLGHWLVTEIRDIFDALENRSEIEKFKCRYQIPVPITPETLNLFENNRTEIETILEEFLEDHKSDTILISDLTDLTYSNKVSLPSLKNALVRMGVIDTKTTHQARKLKNHFGNPVDRNKKHRYLKFSPEYLQKIYKKRRN